MNSQMVVRHVDRFDKVIMTFEISRKFVFPLTLFLLMVFNVMGPSNDHRLGIKAANEDLNSFPLISLKSFPCSSFKFHPIFTLLSCCLQFQTSYIYLCPKELLPYLISFLLYSFSSSKNYF